MIKGSSEGKSPATLYIVVVSRASSKVSEGRIEGIRLANMVYPDPGGPIISTL